MASGFRVALAVTCFLFLGGAALGASDLIFIDYEGPADLGRVSMRVGRNFAQVSYTTHPMVISKTKPWSKRADLTEKDTSPLMRHAQSESIKKYKCQPLMLMPGQDVTVKTLKISVGKSPPWFVCDFVETPEALRQLVELLGEIYINVRPA